MAIPPNTLAGYKDRGANASAIIEYLYTLVPDADKAAFRARLSEQGLIISATGKASITDPRDADNAIGYAQALTAEFTAGTGNAIDWKASGRLATTADHGLSGLADIDGETPVAGDRILVKSQTAAEENGIYVAASGAWSRSADAVDGRLSSGATIYITEGATGGGKTFRLITPDPIVVGSTEQSWTEVAAGGGAPAKTFTVGVGGDFASLNAAFADAEVQAATDTVEFVLLHTDGGGDFVYDDANRTLAARFIKFTATTPEAVLFDGVALTMAALKGIESNNVNFSSTGDAALILCSTTGVIYVTGRGSASFAPPVFENDAAGIKQVVLELHDQAQAAPTANGLFRYTVASTIQTQYTFRDQSKLDLSSGPTLNAPGGSVQSWLLFLRASDSVVLQGLEDGVELSNPTIVGLTPTQTWYIAGVQTFVAVMKMILLTSAAGSHDIYLTDNVVFDQPGYSIDNARRIQIYASGREMDCSERIEIASNSRILVQDAVVTNAPNQMFGVTDGSPYFEFRNVAAGSVGTALMDINPGTDGTQIELHDSSFNILFTTAEDVLVRALTNSEVISIESTDGATDVTAEYDLSSSVPDALAGPGNLTRTLLRAANVPPPVLSSGTVYTIGDSADFNSIDDAMADVDVAAVTGALELRFVGDFRPSQDGEPIHAFVTQAATLACSELAITSTRGVTTVQCGPDDGNDVTVALSNAYRLVLDNVVLKQDTAGGTALFSLQSTNETLIELNGRAAISNENDKTFITTTHSNDNMALIVRGQARVFARSSTVGIIHNTNAGGPRTMTVVLQDSGGIHSVIGGILFSQTGQLPNLLVHKQSATAQLDISPFTASQDTANLGTANANHMFAAEHTGETWIQPSANVDGGLASVNARWLSNGLNWLRFLSGSAATTLHRFYLSQAVGGHVITGDDPVAANELQFSNHVEIYGASTHAISLTADMRPQGSTQAIRFRGFSTFSRGATGQIILSTAGAKTIEFTGSGTAPGISSSASGAIVSVQSASGTIILDMVNVTGANETFRYEVSGTFVARRVFALPNTALYVDAAALLTYVHDNESVPFPSLSGGGAYNTASRNDGFQNYVPKQFKLVHSSLITDGQAQTPVYTLAAGKQYVIAIYGSEENAPLLAGDIDAFEDFTFVAPEIDVTAAAGNGGAAFLVVLPEAAYAGGRLNPDLEGTTSMPLGTSAASVKFAKVQGGAIGWNIVYMSCRYNRTGGFANIVAAVNTDGEVIVNADGAGGEDENGAVAVFERA